ncbi:MAG: hypothetical protein ACLSAP_03510 [Oscillospiraceae bacterium]
MGTVTTGLPGSAASVTNAGTAQNAQLNFIIPQGPTGPTGPAGAAATAAYGQFLVSTAAAAPATALNITADIVRSDNGEITAQSPTVVNLAQGYVYQVSYHVLATIPADSYLEIAPEINGAANQNYTARAVSSAANAQVGVSGSFLVDARTAAVTLSFVYNGTAATTATSGTVSIVKIDELQAPA